MVFLKLYIRLHDFFHTYLNINLRGLGWLFRKTIKNDIILDFNENKKIFINSKICDNYGRQLIGKFNEPETHAFINTILNEVNELQFVDIGANVGEFILAYSDNNKVKAIHAFEPQKEQFASLTQLIKINNFKNVTINNIAVSNEEGEFLFNIEPTNTLNSGLVRNDSNKGVKIKTITIDSYHLDKNLNTLFLIDIEGSELLAMQGAKEFIKANQPIIIFEYNYVSKRSFHVSEIQTELGDGYSIFRLNRKGNLDNELENAWNLVAVPKILSYYDKIV